MTNNNHIPTDPTIFCSTDFFSLFFDISKVNLSITLHKIIKYNQLVNPAVADDGFTEGNLIYHNTISNSEDGISAARSRDNILENNRFTNIEASEYRLSGDASITIRGQYLDNALIAEAGLATGNIVEILDSGTIEVTEGEADGDEEDDKKNLYNTDSEPYRRTLRVIVLKSSHLPPPPHKPVITSEIGIYDMTME